MKTDGGVVMLLLAGVVAGRLNATPANIIRLLQD